MICILCNKEYSGIENCPSCGFPKNGSEQDKILYLADKEKNKQEFRKIEKEFDIEKITAFVIGGLLTIFAIFLIVNTPNFIENINPVILFPLVAFFYGAFITKKPLMTTSVTFIVVLIILIAEFMIFKGDIFNNINLLIIDGIVIIGSIRGIYYAYKFKNLEKIINVSTTKK